MLGLPVVGYGQGEGMDRRMFMGTAAAAAALMALPGAVAATSVPAPPARRLPLALSRGDTVGLVSPSAAMDDPLNLQIAQEVLQALGLRVRTGAHFDSRYGHLAGSDTQRADDLNTMFADPDIRAVVAVRGGSGAARVLPLLDYGVIAANPKPLLGYSDITALHCAIQARTGLVTFHGPNGSGSWNRFNADQFRRVFFDRELMRYENVADPGDELVPRTGRTVTLTGGRARGRLLGGNLTVLTALAGSPYLPDFSGAILFLEDVSEAPYRVDRMFSTLKLMGALDRVAGVIFGECTDCQPGRGHGSLTLSQILDDHLRPLGVPVYSGAMIGHIREQFIVPVGADVEMDADAGTFRLLAPVFAR